MPTRTRLTALLHPEDSAPILIDHRQCSRPRSHHRLQHMASLAKAATAHGALTIITTVADESTAS